MAIVIKAYIIFLKPTNVFRAKQKIAYIASQMLASNAKKDFFMM